MSHSHRNSSAMNEKGVVVVGKQNTSKPLMLSERHHQDKNDNEGLFRIPSEDFMHRENLDVDSLGDDISVGSDVAVISVTQEVDGESNTVLMHHEDGVDELLAVIREKDKVIDLQAEEIETLKTKLTNSQDLGHGIESESKSLIGRCGRLDSENKELMEQLDLPKQGIRVLSRRNATQAKQTQEIQSQNTKLSNRVSEVQQMELETPESMSANEGLREELEHCRRDRDSLREELVIVTRDRDAGRLIKDFSQSDANTY